MSTDWLLHFTLPSHANAVLTHTAILLLMIQNCLNQYRDTPLLKMPSIIKYALVLLLFLDVIPVPLPHILCLHVGNPTQLHSLHVGKSYAHPISKSRPQPNPKTNPNPSPNPANPNHCEKWRWWWTLTVCRVWLCMTLCRDLAVGTAQYFNNDWCVLMCWFQWLVNLHGVSNFIVLLQWCFDCKNLVAGACKKN